MQAEAVDLLSLFCFSLLLLYFVFNLCFGLKRLFILNQANISACSLFIPLITPLMGDLAHDVLACGEGWGQLP